MGSYMWWAIVILVAMAMTAGLWTVLRRGRHSRRRPSDVPAGAARHAAIPASRLVQTNPEGGAEEPMISLVLLLREPRQLDQQTMARHIRDAWGIELDVDDPAAKQFVVCVAPGAMIQIDGVNFLVHNWPRPYVDEPDSAGAQITELRLREAMTQHRAWLSVDLLRQDAGLNEKQVYQYIGKLVAALGDQDTLAVYAPQTHRMLPFDEVTRRKLRSDDVLAAMTDEMHDDDEPPAVLAVPHGGDDRLAAAVAEARRRWPEFVQAFEQRNGEEHFAVKMPFSEGDHTEYLWIEVSAIENDFVYGKLGNKPVHVRRLNEGDSVRARTADLNDWAYIRRGKPHGMFTMQIIQEAQRPPAEQDES